VCNLTSLGKENIMFGWFKKNKAAVTIDWEEYKGFRIAATPIREGGQYRISGVIEYDQEGMPPKHHTFVRADLIPGQDEAARIALLKARLMVDQMGVSVFTTS
jgi:hypothetical protein